MEGVFSFFLESAFLGLFLFGEKRLSPWAHWGSAFMVFLDPGFPDSLSSSLTHGCSTPLPIASAEWHVRSTSFWEF